MPAIRRRRGGISGREASGSHALCPLCSTEIYADAALLPLCTLEAQSVRQAADAPDLARKQADGLESGATGDGAVAEAVFPTPLGIGLVVSRKDT